MRVSKSSLQAGSSERSEKLRPTVLIVVHEASRTGAPILAWNIVEKFRAEFNVVTILLDGGALSAVLENSSTAMITLPKGTAGSSRKLHSILKQVVATYNPKYALANGMATHQISGILEDLGVPVVALVHELNNEFPAPEDMEAFYRKASRLVFSARMVAAASEAECPGLRARKYEVLTQGSAKLPDLKHLDGQRSRSLKLMLSSFNKKTFVVAGMGSLNYRKGVDLFIAIASDLFRQYPSMDFKFVWVGHIFPLEVKYELFLRQQIARSGVGSRVVLFDEVSNLDPLYRRADVFLLSSRLDPFPNVAIDAAIKGLPIVCFENASGIAEMLGEQADTRQLIVPHQDTASATRLIRRLYDDETFRATVSSAVKQKARSFFSMSRYIKALKLLGQSCIDERQ